MKLLQGMQARNIGPGGMSGRVTSIAAEPGNESVIYVGTASGGLWKTSNGGTNFEPLFDEQQVASIGAVAVDPSNPDVIWAGTGEGNPRNSLNGGYGIYKSLDGGRSWKLTGLEETRHIHRIIVHPSKPEVVYVGAIGSPWGPHAQRGVYKTTDGGLTWEKVLFVNESTGVADLVIDPRNPDKLLAAMWEHRRWPWFFKSGGPGSGIYMTVDGGEEWKKLTHEDGLPKGELGRIGLAISKSDPAYIYALVESEKNAIYRSTDGGYTWSRRGDRNIGSRPFYYADIYVDPENENRLYSLYSMVNVSQDGGMTFSTLISYNIHLDHHAWWIHPDNPDFMIDGNDGGLAITYDRGANWRHVTNLPVSQFYHIRVDDEIPYNLYGGMQDNGSWRGPAYTWTGGGIINTFWDFLIGGDGFDVVPVPGDPATCYAQSQQGNVRRINLQTGESVDIKPARTGEEPLRFHWNAAIAQDPFDVNTIYFGSQFVHRSTDRGDSWTMISPDLTTNDTAKQNYGESGGLTYDVTGAETHTTILAISPSPVDADVIWVGTDDGNIQVTTDGGKRWTNCSPRIREFPDSAWVPQIVPSVKNAGEAFVVVNNYRRNDYQPYLYHTTDFGNKWTRMVDESDVDGFVLSFAQDPLEPDLQFLGTEYGLYVTIDGGEYWTKWTNGFPTVPTRDMVIHPREHDLVVGTFGRSAFVIDDLRPLRALAKDHAAVMQSTVFAVEPPEAYLVQFKNNPGYYFTGDAYYEGENRAPGARISYFVRLEDEGKNKDTLTIRILDQDGNPLRTLKEVPKNGLNRTGWRLDRKGVRVNYSEKEASGTGGGRGYGRGGRGNDEPGGGGWVAPGEYTLELTFREDTSETTLRVESDPRISYDAEGMQASREKQDSLIRRLEELDESLDRVRQYREQYNLVKKLAGKDQPEALKEATKAAGDKLDELAEAFFQDESVQGIYEPEDALYVRMQGTWSILMSGSPLTENQLLKLEGYMTFAGEAIGMVDDFTDSEWAAFKTAVEEADLSLFAE